MRSPFIPSPTTPSALKPHLPNLLPVIEKHLNHKSVSLANNAGWALGECAMHDPTSLKPYALSVGRQLSQSIVRNAHYHAQQRNPFSFNMCITLGRLAAACPTDLATIFHEFAGPWLVGSFCILRQVGMVGGS